MTGRAQLDTEQATPAAVPAGTERAIRLRLEDLLGPVEGWSRSLVAALITSFLSRAEDYLEALADAIASADPDAITCHGHGLKGMAGNLGASDLAALSATMEACGRSGRIAAAPMLLTRMSAELERVRPAMREVLMS